MLATQRRNYKLIISFPPINEVSGMFKDEHPGLKVGKGKFAALRPKQALLNSKIPQNVCLCKYHENFIRGVDKLHKESDNFPTYNH